MSEPKAIPEIADFVKVREAVPHLLDMRDMSKSPAIVAVLDFMFSDHAWQLVLEGYARALKDRDGFKQLAEHNEKRVAEAWDAGVTHAYAAQGILPDVKLPGLLAGNPYRKSGS